MFTTDHTPSFFIESVLVINQRPASSALIGYATQSPRKARDVANLLDDSRPGTGHLVWLPKSEHTFQFAPSDRFDVILLDLATASAAETESLLKLHLSRPTPVVVVVDTAHEDRGFAALKRGAAGLVYEHRLTKKSLGQALEHALTPAGDKACAA